MAAMPTQIYVRQRGTVIIVTLWTITLLTILITVLAGQIRLSAQAAFFHQQDLRSWANVQAAVNQAEMELMLEYMPRPPEAISLDTVGRNPLYRFNGQLLHLYYPQAADVAVRIYDHAGKINLREIAPSRLRAMLEKKLGANAGLQIDLMIEAWDDWQDLNDQASINGAEAAYYADLESPYKPRNGKLESVEEILLIRGFAEVFSDVDLDAAFTLYGENELVNLNLATVEAMQLLPGLDDALIAEILAYRVDNEFSGNGDVAQIVPAENMAELRPWLNSRKMTAYYSIMVYPTTPAAGSSLTSGAQADADAAEVLGEEVVVEEVAEQATTAFTEVVEITGFTDLPKILKINPYQTIPLRGMVATINERNSADKP